MHHARLVDDDVRARLSHVLWIGGGPCVGKTTLARLLAGKYDLKIYNIDWHHVREHRQRPGGTVPGWDQLSMDERWVLPSPSQLAERDIASWTTRFSLVIEDVLALPSTRPIIAEGPSAFPWSVAPVIRSPRQAIFLLPTTEVHDDVLARRNRDKAPTDTLEGQTSDPKHAQKNIRGRNALMRERIVSYCEEKGLRHVTVDGSRDLDDSLALLEEHFSPHLPATLNV